MSVICFELNSSFYHYHHLRTTNQLMYSFTHTAVRGDVERVLIQYWFQSMDSRARSRVELKYDTSNE